jgi:hypothetical protein
MIFLYSQAKKAIRGIFYSSMKMRVLVATPTRAMGLRSFKGNSFASRD